jgi:hypothetical protein
VSGKGLLDVVVAVVAGRRARVRMKSLKDRRREMRMSVPLYSKGLTGLMSLLLRRNRHNL